MYNSCAQISHLTVFANFRFLRAILEVQNFNFCLSKRLNTKVLKQILIRRRPQCSFLRSNLAFCKDWLQMQNCVPYFRPAWVFALWNWTLTANDQSRDRSLRILLDTSWRNLKTTWNCIKLVGNVSVAIWNWNIYFWEANLPAKQSQVYVLSDAWALIAQVPFKTSRGLGLR